MYNHWHHRCCNWSEYFQRIFLRSKKKKKKKLKNHQIRKSIQELLPLDSSPIRLSSLFEHHQHVASHFSTKIHITKYSSLRTVRVSSLVLLQNFVMICHIVLLIAKLVKFFYYQKQSSRCIKWKPCSDWWKELFHDHSERTLIIESHGSQGAG